MGSILDDENDLILALRSQIFEYLRFFFYRHALEYLQSPRSEKKNDQNNAAFLRKRLTIIELFGVLWSVGTRFRQERQSYCMIGPEQKKCP